MADRSGKETSDDLIPHNVPKLGINLANKIMCTMCDGRLSGAMFGAVWARETSRVCCVMAHALAELR